MIAFRSYREKNRGIPSDMSCIQRQVWRDVRLATYSGAEGAALEHQVVLLQTVLQRMLVPGHQVLHDALAVLHVVNAALQQGVAELQLLLQNGVQRGLVVALGDLARPAKNITVKIYQHRNQLQQRTAVAEKACFCT
jgi:hypothetical protein